jgi:predicted phage tail protein
MQRVAWTDERLDDLSRRMDRGFDRVDHDIRDLRAEMQGLRREMNGGFAELRREVEESRHWMLRLNVGILVSVVAAILLRAI